MQQYWQTTWISLYSSAHVAWANELLAPVCDWLLPPIKEDEQLRSESCWAHTAQEVSAPLHLRGEQAEYSDISFNKTTSVHVPLWRFLTKGSKAQVQP